MAKIHSITKTAIAKPKERPIVKLSKQEGEAICNRLVDAGATVKLIPRQVTERVESAVSLQPAVVQPPKDTRPDVAVIDAWMHALDLAQGLENVLSAAACSDEGLTREGCGALDIAAEQLVEHMKMVNWFFNPRKE